MHGKDKRERGPAHKAPKQDLPARGPDQSKDEKTFLNEKKKEKIT